MQRHFVAIVLASLACVTGCEALGGGGTALPLGGIANDPDGGPPADLAPALSGDDCLDDLVARRSPLLTDRGQLALRNYDNQNVALTPASGYHLYHSDDPGTLVHKSHDLVYLRVYPRGHAPIAVAAFQDASNKGWYSIAHLSPGPYDILATTDANRAACPKATSDAVYTISLE